MVPHMGINVWVILPILIAQMFGWGWVVLFFPTLLP